MKIQPFTVHNQGRQFTCLLGEADDGRLAATPALLLNFAGAGQEALTLHPHAVPGQRFVAAGHRVLSLNLPCHGGEDPQYADGIVGWREMLLKGMDPFVRFIGDVRAALAVCQQRGWLPGSLVAAGVSRGGYCVARLVADGLPLAGAALLAPVVDWRRLREFADVAHEAVIADLALERWTDPLAGKAIYTAIGSSDDRVGTDACVGLYQALLRAHAASGASACPLVLHVDDETIGHGLADQWYDGAAAWLLRRCAK